MKYAASIAATFELAFMETNNLLRKNKQQRTKTELLAGNGNRLKCNDEDKCHDSGKSHFDFVWRNVPGMFQEMGVLLVDVSAHI